MSVTVVRHVRRWVRSRRHATAGRNRPNPPRPGSFRPALGPTLRSGRRGRRFAVAVSTLLAALVAAVGLPAVAQAAAVHYVALGDSYSSGVGSDDYSLSAGICLRTPHAFPALWAASHAPASFDFAACAGATTADVLNNQLGALSAQTTLVSLTVGGNDIGFANVVLTCKFSTTQACADAVTGAENQARTTLPAKLAATYAAIASRAPHARLVVLGYPRLFETNSCGWLSMSLANRQALNQGADVLEAVISAAAQGAGASYVSLQTWFTGHRVCAPTPWINGTVAIAVDSYHPNASGYSRAYLPALVSVIG